MNLERKCLLDMDGVLADFIGGLFKLRGVPRVDPTAFECVSRGEWEKMDFDFWANLEPTPEFAPILGTVEEIFGRENVCLLTSPCMTRGCHDGKYAWIRKHLPEYKRRYLIGPAKHFCAGPNTYLVDDSDDNCDAFVKAGGQAFLVPRAWNALRAWKVSDMLSHVRFYLADKEVV